MKSIASMPKSSFDSSGVARGSLPLSVILFSVQVASSKAAVTGHSKRGQPLCTQRERIARPWSERAQCGTTGDGRATAGREDEGEDGRACSAATPSGTRGFITYTQTQQARCTFSAGDRPSTLAGALSREVICSSSRNTNPILYALRASRPRGLRSRNC